MVDTKPSARRSAAARLFVWLQYALPQHGLSRLMLWLTRLRLGAVTHWLIRRFSAHFAVDLREAAAPDVESYPSFNAFFTRALRADARPLPAETAILLSPVDGAVSAAGRIDGTRLFQCKGQWFGLADLLGDAELAAPLVGGYFATLYLSPRDYHRIHMPLDGHLTQMLHVPGRLFSVNPTTVAGVPGLFARNERVVTLFATRFGPMALVLVGAIFVGSIETVWAGEVTPPRGQRLTRIDYPAPGAHEAGITLARGEEMGRFNMGSTVILLLPAVAAEHWPHLHAGTQVRCRAPLKPCPVRNTQF
ncbi:archaetidylserine decarboxylase [Rhabdochromatium marinum]|uniref:archaetidylserine decarboxylase n=1 Tax=Rhabdochromatium marinum TaxID=48729 RepID=UPI0019059962|nr:archaetidylserine decarboxylase [Rhabdochromatium marinum]MBK1647728.1 phosphatidylserine decarboxylase [Rhabdochromatium marinum]